MIQRLGIIPGLLILAMAAITSVDVVGRYVFGRPIGGAFEMTEIAMGVVIFAGIGLAAMAREHIRVDLIGSVLPPKLRRAQLVLGDVVCAGVCAVMGWRVLERGSQLVAVREDFLMLGFQRGYVAWVMAALCGLAVLAFLHSAWRAATGDTNTKDEATGL